MVYKFPEFKVLNHPWQGIAIVWAYSVSIYICSQTFPPWRKLSHKGKQHISCPRQSPFSTKRACTIHRKCCWRRGIAHSKYCGLYPGLVTLTDPWTLTRVGDTCCVSFVARSYLSLISGYCVVSVSPWGWWLNLLLLKAWFVMLDVTQLVTRRCSVKNPLCLHI